MSCQAEVTKFLTFRPNLWNIYLCILPNFKNRNSPMSFGHSAISIKPFRFTLCIILIIFVDIQNKMHKKTGVYTQVPEKLIRRLITFKNTSSMKKRRNMSRNISSTNTWRYIRVNVLHESFGDTHKSIKGRSDEDLFLTAQFL